MKFALFKKRDFIWFGIIALAIVFLFGHQKYKLPRHCTGNMLVQIGDQKLLISKEVAPHIRLEDGTMIDIAKDRPPYDCDTKNLEHVRIVQWPDLYIIAIIREKLEFRAKSEKDNPSLNPSTPLITCGESLGRGTSGTSCQGSYEYPSGLSIGYWYWTKEKNPKDQYLQFEQASRSKVKKMLDDAKKFDASESK